MRCPKRERAARGGAPGSTRPLALYTDGSYMMMLHAPCASLLPHSQRTLRGAMAAPRHMLLRQRAPHYDTMWRKTGRQPAVPSAAVQKFTRGQVPQHQGQALPKRSEQQQRGSHRRRRWSHQQQRGNHQQQRGRRAPSAAISPPSAAISSPSAAISSLSAAISSPSAAISPR